MAAQQTHTGWTFNDCGAPEYLDGIQSQFDVRNATGSPVAYAFREDECRLISAAPELLEACREAAKAFLMYAEMHAAKGTVEGAQKAVANHSRAKTCEAAIAKATGAAQ